jgi:hypothetical protein
MHLHAAPMPDKNTLQAVMYGPLVLAAKFNEEPRANWYRHFAAEEKQEPAPTLQFKGKIEDPASWLEPAGEALAFRTVAQSQSVTFSPLAGIVHERYSVYHEVEEKT